MKYIKTFEMFDSGDLKDKLEIPRINGDLDPNELANTNKPQLSSTMLLHHALLEEIYYLRYAKAFIDDEHIEYQFKHNDITVCFGISSEMITEMRFPIVTKTFVDGKSEESGIPDVYNYEELVDYLLDADKAILNTLELPSFTKLNVVSDN